ncbi:MAG: TorF family putative porin [Acidobacteriota bacterium]
MKTFRTPPSLWLRTAAAVAAVAMPLFGAGTAGAESVSFSGSAAVASDYVYRGISQTLGRPALQLGAGAEWGEVSVFFWGSNVDFGDELADFELDFGVSWGRDFGEDTALSLSFVRYVYAGDRGADYSEFLAELRLGALTLILAVAPEFFGTEVRANYFQLSHDFELPGELGLTLSAGYNAFDGEAPGTLRNPEFLDLAATVSRSFGEFGLDVTLSDTTLEDDRQATTRLVASIHYAF